MIHQVINLVTKCGDLVCSAVSTGNSVSVRISR
jgi:hypothetical protein